QDTLFGDGRLELVAVPLSQAEGFMIRLRWLNPPLSPGRVVWAFGGASGYTTNKSARIDKLMLSEDDAAQNAVHPAGDRFSLKARTLGGKQADGGCSLPGRWFMREAETVLQGPRALERGAGFKNPVAVFSGSWTEPTNAVYVLITLAGTLSFDHHMRD